MLINSYINEKYDVNLRLPDMFDVVSFALVAELLGCSVCWGNVKDFTKCI